MDNLAPNLHSDLENFLQDITVSFRTHGGRSAAVVWPRGDASVVQALVAAHDKTESSVDETTCALGLLFGEILKRRVGVTYRVVPAGKNDEEREITADTFAVMLQGALEVQLSPLGDGWPAEVGSFRHRLLAGEVLYIPIGFGCTMVGQRSLALLMELTLDD
ncbi:hypothetical protein [Streptomyces shenzhenensis]|uniref:hypothetical protein n=1 Tax=Streptomyces shenzhenensis TaxID=943815 RepID=UPI0015F09BFF|nr:hypothetical protein [Streptomyces shenzhenensis]